MFVWGKNDLNPEQEKAIYNEKQYLINSMSGKWKNKNNKRIKIAYRTF